MAANDIPTLPATLAPEGSISPPSGSRMVKVKTPYGVQTVYVPLSASPDEALASIRDRLLPKLAEAQQAQTEKTALSNAAIPLDTPFGTFTIPPEIGSQIIGYGHGISTFLHGVKQAVTGGSEAQQKEKAAGDVAFAPLAKQSLGARIADVAGGASIPAALSAAFPALAPEAFSAATATPAASMINAATQGGLFGGLQYVEPGGSRAANTISAARDAALLQLPFSGLQGIAQGPRNLLSPPQRAAVEDMTNIPGVQPLPSQLTGNPTLSNIEQVISYFPFSGPKISARNAANREAINTATLGALGAPPGTKYGTPDVLAGLKKQATDVMNAVEEAGHPVQVTPDAATALREIRKNALNANTPNTKLADTIDRLIGSEPEISPDVLKSLGSAATPEEQTAFISKLGPAAYTQKTPPKYAGGNIPADYFKTVQSDLSEWSKNGDYLAGQANKLLTQTAIDTLPGDFGQQLQQARQRYSALMTADSAIDPATGNVDMRKLMANLSNAGQDVARYGQSSNPMLTTLGDLATAARGMPPPPAEGSQTAARSAWMKFLGLLPEAATAGAAAYGTHAATGGELGLSAIAGLMPFLAANYGTKAYLSPAFARYAESGMPWLDELLKSGATAGGTALPAVGASLSASQ